MSDYAILKDYVRMILLILAIIIIFIYLWENADYIVVKIVNILSEIVCNKVFD